MKIKANKTYNKQWEHSDASNFLFFNFVMKKLSKNNFINKQVNCRKTKQVNTTKPPLSKYFFDEFSESELARLVGIRHQMIIKKEYLSNEFES